MVWIGCVRCEKSRRDIVARTFALIAPVDPVLHRVSCSYETIPKSPKHYATHQNMSPGSIGVDLVHSLWIIPMWLRGTNFCINCTSWPCFASSFMQLRNDPKYIPTLCNAPKHEIQGPMGRIGCFHFQKIPTWLRGTNFCINCTSSSYFASSLM